MNNVTMGITSLVIVALIAVLSFPMLFVVTQLGDAIRLNTALGHPIPALLM
jgi:hypothetical protein